MLAVGGAEEPELAIKGVAKCNAIFFGKAGDGVEKKFLALVRVLQFPGFAAVSCFVDARLLAFPAGHHVGNLLGERHNPSKVKRIAAADVQPLPRFALVDGLWRSPRR